MCEASRKTIYLDFDGTMVNTIKSIVGLYNEDFRYRRGFVPVNWWDVKTWDFVECEFAPLEYLDEYFNQPRFFERLEFMPWAKDVITLLQESYTIKVVSMGNAPNLVGKKGWLKFYFPDVEFVGIDFAAYTDKAHIDMSDGILIDDCSENLRTSNAAEKICFGEEYVWNEDWTGERLASWMDIKQRLLGGPVTCEEDDDV